MHSNQLASPRSPALPRSGFAALLGLLVLVTALSVWGVVRDARDAQQERLVLDRMLIVHDGLAGMWHP